MDAGFLAVRDQRERMTSSGVAPGNSRATPEHPLAAWLAQHPGHSTTSPLLAKPVGTLPYRRVMAARKRPTPEDAATARHILLDGLARDADIFELLSQLAPLHPRDDTFPGEILLRLAADALGTRLFPGSGPDIALDLAGSRADSKGVTVQVYRPAARPPYATG